MKEEDIRPQDVFDKYLELAKEDAITYFSTADRDMGCCPACGETGKFAFDKNGFTYEICNSCLTLYVNPRPAVSAFLRYYTESPSSKFWATTFYKITAEARRNRLWKPKAKAVHEIALRYFKGSTAPTIIDIGGGYGIFAEEIRELIESSPVVIEPGPSLAEICRQKGLRVVEKFLEDVTKTDVPQGSKLFSSFELFEHLHNPERFLRCIHDLMSGSDIFIFTTLSGMGVDIQVLWEHSKSVTPPHHLNFFNPKSIKLLLARTGFDVLDVTTPGKLDLDILHNSRELIGDRFWRNFIETASDEERESWQQFISFSGRSSHMMVVCQKRPI